MFEFARMGVTGLWDVSIHCTFPLIFTLTTHPYRFFVLLENYDRSAISLSWMASKGILPILEVSALALMRLSGSFTLHMEEKARILNCGLCSFVVHGL